MSLSERDLKAALLPPKPGTTWGATWATVSRSSPQLMVVPDGQDEAVPATGLSHYEKGERVWCLLTGDSRTHRRTVTAIGKAGDGVALSSTVSLSSAGVKVGSKLYPWANMSQSVDYETATVSSTSPLTFRISSTGQYVGGVAARALGVGDSVGGLLLGSSFYALFISEPEDHVYINGQWYRRSGVINSPGWAVARTDGNFYTGNLSAPAPYTPPAGYTFSWQIQGTTGYTFASCADRKVVDGVQTLRVMQVGSNSTTALTRLAWQLVRL